MGFFRHFSEEDMLVFWNICVKMEDIFLGGIGCLRVYSNVNKTLSLPEVLISGKLTYSLSLLQLISFLESLHS